MCKKGRRQRLSQYTPMISPTALLNMPLGSNFCLTALKREMCYVVSAPYPHISQGAQLTLGSRFFVAFLNTSRVFLVQCGRHGNSSMMVLARFGSDMHRD